MILKILPGGDADRLVAEVSRDLLQLQIISSRKVAARNFGAHHEAPGLVAPGPFQLNARVPVVLLIRPMKLEELDFLLAEVGGVTAQGLGDRSSQVTTLLFNLLGFTFGHGASSQVEPFSPVGCYPLNYAPKYFWISRTTSTKRSISSVVL